MSNEWLEQARRRLVEAATSGRSWGYRHRGTPAAEPTALAGLALVAADPERARGAARWLGSMQRDDGSVGLTAALPGSGWATPLAVLLWAALEVEPERRRAAVAYLLEARGVSIPRDEDGVVGHDTTLVGWPWVAGTHSWVEPTALGLLALRCESQSDHARAVEGRRLLRDRAILGGGWNLGNSIIFHTPLRPLPAPTGLALLALAGTVGAEEVARLGVHYLETCLPTVRAPESLAWGLLGLRAWGTEPTGADVWLAESWGQEGARPASPLPLALLLLAHDREALHRLGLGEKVAR